MNTHVVTLYNWKETTQNFNEKLKSTDDNFDFWEGVTKTHFWHNLFLQDKDFQIKNSSEGIKHLLVVITPNVIDKHIYRLKQNKIKTAHT